MKNYNSSVEALDDLKKRGYDADFETESFCLYCGDLDLRMNEEEFHVDETYKFDGDSIPEDNAVVYAISSSTGVKGTILDERGAFSDNISSATPKETGKI